MDHIASRNGHEYREIEIRDRAQVHLGDQIGVTINSKVAARTDYAGHYAHNALHPVTTFVERPALHNKLRTQLHKPTPHEGQNTRIVNVYGAGGAGKSQLVLNYIQQHRQDYAAVFWIEAGTKAAVERDFLQIYQLLYDVHHLARLGPTRVEDAVPAVKRWFYGRQKRWLFVFDSADNVDHEQDSSYVDLRYFLPDDPSVHVVITTRNASMRKIGGLGGVEVAEMTLTEAAELFLKQAEMTTVTSGLEMEVAAIVEELGCLALAVTLAGSYVAAIPRLHADIRQYLPEYRQRRKELLDQKPEWLVHQYGMSVLATWEASFKAVERHSSQAGQLLSLLGLLNWDDIFVSLFEVGEEQDSIGWMSTLFPSDAVTLYNIEGFFSTLQTYSLIKFQPNSNSYSMHRLIHAWVYDRLSDEAQERYILSSMLLLAKALDNVQHHSSKMKPRLIPHLMSSFTKVSMLINRHSLRNEVVLNYFRRITEFVDSAGRWNDTLLIEKFVFERVRFMYGAEHPDTISAMNNLAATLGDMGELQAAVSMLREVLEKRKRILGEEHPDTISAMNNLAATLGDMGELQAAVSMNREVLEKRKRILGEEHPDTISAMNNLANTLGDIGELQAAVSMKREVLEKRKRILGEEHPDTISAMNNLAATLGDMGELQAAVSMNREVLEKRKRILGEEHPDTISAMNNLAATLGDMGELQAAVSMNREVLEKRKRILGEEHPDTISAMNNLANTLGDMGELQAAVSMKREVLEKRKRILGEEHPDTISAMRNLQIIASRFQKVQHPKSEAGVSRWHSALRDIFPWKKRRK